MFLSLKVCIYVDIFVVSSGGKRRNAWLLRELPEILFFFLQNKSSDLYHLTSLFIYFSCKLR